MAGETYTASLAGNAVRRIRTPHVHDVLSGRGGGINAHPGNVVFREWVRVRKEDYNLAPNKNEKMQVALEVMNQVQSQDPPGRFLQRDQTVTSGTWWIEIDSNRALAKTAQALREGAPQIRATHKDEMKARKIQFEKDHPKDHSTTTTTTSSSKKGNSNSNNNRKRKSTSQATRTTAVTAAPKYARGGSTLTKRLVQGGGSNVSGGVGGGGGSAILWNTVNSNNKNSNRVVPSTTTTTTTSYPRAIETLQENVRAAKSLADAQWQQEHNQQQQQPARTYYTASKNDWTRHTAQGFVDDGADTPPLVPQVAPSNIGSNVNSVSGPMEPLSIGLPRDETSSSRATGTKRGTGGLTRVHSLALSECSLGNITEAGMDDSPTMDEEFVNPFADESDMLSRLPPSSAHVDRSLSSSLSNSNHRQRNGLTVNSSALRNVSSSGDEDYAYSYDTHTDENQYSNQWYVDLPVDENTESSLDSEFVTGVKDILDAVHPSDLTSPVQGDDDYIPTLLMPWKGFNGGLFGRRSTSSSSSSSRNNIRSDTRQQ